MTDKKQPEALAFCWATELAMTQQPVTLSVTEAREVSAEMQRLHAENTALQQGYAAARLEIESLRAQGVAPAGAQQPAPSAAVASKAVRAAIRAANMQLVRTGDDEFMLVTLKQVTPQADTQPTPQQEAQEGLGHGN